MGGDNQVRVGRASRSKCDRDFKDQVIGTDQVGGQDGALQVEGLIRKLQSFAFS